MTVELPVAYAYVSEHLLMCTSEVNRTKERLVRFAPASNIELAATFVEENGPWPVAFERLLRAVIRNQAGVVILPSALHFAVLGSPNHIKDYFEAATRARVVTAQLPPRLASFPHSSLFECPVPCISLGAQVGTPEPAGAVQ